jgi:alkylation response protein AidB-like acyl-CoA dehydrogenase
VRTAKTYIGLDETGRLADRDFRFRLIQNQINAHAYALTVRRAAAESRDSNSPSNATSIMKNASSKLYTDTAELIVEAMGQQGLGWEGEAFTPEELAAGRQYLRVKSSTIAGGSTEVQNNIIAKRILGLPDANRHTY